MEVDIKAQSKREDQKFDLGSSGDFMLIKQPDPKNIS